MMHGQNHIKLIKELRKCNTGNENSPL